jgi:hypothetical protein
MFVSCVYMLLSWVGIGLCDRLITRPEESYPVSVCDYETSIQRRARPKYGLSCHREKINLCIPREQKGRQTLHRMVVSIPRT